MIESRTVFSVYLLQKQPSGDYKCIECITEDIQKKIVSVTPDSIRAKQILAEEEKRVKTWNDYSYNTNYLNRRLGGDSDIVQPTSNRFKTYKYKLKGK